MNWRKGFTARYYYTIVDPMTWRDTERHELTGGSISKTAEALMESADMDITTIPRTGELWIRIWLDASQRGSAENEALFTGLMAVPEVEWDGYRKTYKAECYSVLKPADDVLLPRGWYVPAGTNGAYAAMELLEDAGPAPVTREANAPTLAAPIVAEDGETNLSMAIKIVNAVGWRFRIGGDGNITICPKAEEPSIRLSAEDNDMVEMALVDKKDWFSCPNVFRATFNGVTAIARDDKTSSPYSTVSRGREIWKEETDCALGDTESIEEYVVRRLREEQSPARICSYARRFYPDIYPGDIVQLHYPAQDIDGDFRIRSQQIELGYNARTEEESEAVIQEE